MSEVKTDSVVNVSGDNDSGIDLSTNDVVAIKTADSERLRVDASGNVGIGTTVTGDAELIVYGDDAATIYKNSTTGTGNGDGLFVGLAKSGGTDGYVYQRENTNLIFGTNDTERGRFDTSGNLLIGSTSFSEDGSTNSIKINPHEILTGTTSTAANTHLAFSNPNGRVGSITTSGSATAYNTSSDHRLKENVADMTGAIARVKQLAPKRFNFISDPDDTTVDGFLAHEAQTVVPEAVHGTHNEVDDDGNAVMQGIDQSKLVPLLTGALKEAIVKIEALEARVTALEDA